VSLREGFAGEKETPVQEELCGGMFAVALHPYACIFSRELVLQTDFYVINM
jgi:hypothetical protein